MILVDLNQVMISNLMAQIGNHHNVEIDEGLVRHMVLNTLRANRSKFVKEYGEMIICCDDKNYWRKKTFPYYKANRKQYRNKSELDWSSIFKTLNGIREDLKEIFPYKVIQIESAEADDIIGTIVHDIEGALLVNGKSKPILILSGDKDFIQLHAYSNVNQYDPVRKKFVKHDDPELYLKEHIARGDRGDGIPNILSKDDCFVNGRQRPLRSRLLNTIIEMNLEDVENGLEHYRANWNRNRRLVDLSLIPAQIRVKVKDAYEEENTKTRDKMFGYFIDKKLKNLIEHIGEF